RGWGWLALILTAVPIWALVAGVTVSQLFLFANLRKLAFDQIHNSWNGTRNVMKHIPQLHGLINVGNDVVSWVIGHWWVVIPAAELLAVEGATVLAAAISRPAIRRVDRALGPPPLPVPESAHAGNPGPVPVVLRDVSYRYPSSEAYALSGVSIEVPAQALVAVTGLNGSGKSTLARLLAGIVEAEGELTRPGSVALGRTGGTAVIFQRPESQVLGIRIRDDVTWGMDAATARTIDVEQLLALVGLEGLEDEETATLSGGQLQRLAIAAAVARRPCLLVSDESTSMLDPSGRQQVAELLARLVCEQGLTVVHVTHRREEAALADVMLTVTAGSVQAVETRDREVTR
ncbi:MAG TPA: ATP-binding cassette domain-containing protein, partial [Acidimicrobiales bacterium]|nr:ATP-binding cassette domain-containing protein [Acidimicrobiales bacterium]